MKAVGAFELMRVWAALTGIVLAVSFFVALCLGLMPGQMLPMLVAAIGGFELVLYAQDIWARRRARG